MPTLTPLERELVTALKLAHADLLRAWHGSETRESFPHESTIRAVSEAIAKAEPPKPRRWLVEFPDEKASLIGGKGIITKVDIIREVKPITREAIGASTAVIMGWKFTQASAAFFLRDLCIEAED